MNQQIQYPRIPHDKKRCIKLTLYDIQLIRMLYMTNKVTSTARLASMFFVTPMTIKYWVDPLFRQIVLERRIAYGCEKWKNDPDYRARNIQKVKESQAYHRSIDPSFIEYNRHKDVHVPFRSFIKMIERNT